MKKLLLLLTLFALISMSGCNQIFDIFNENGSLPIDNQIIYVNSPCDIGYTTLRLTYSYHWDTEPNDIPDEYRIQVSKDSLFEEVVFDEIEVNGSQVFINDLDSAQKYYYRIKGIRGNRSSEFTIPRAVTIMRNTDCDNGFTLNNNFHFTNNVSLSYSRLRDERILYLGLEKDSELMGSNIEDIEISLTLRSNPYSNGAIPYGQTIYKFEDILLSPDRFNGQLIYNEDYDSQTDKPIVGGTVEVTKHQDGRFEIKYQLEVANFEVSGEYKGMPDIYDLAELPFFLREQFAIDGHYEYRNSKTNLALFHDYPYLEFTYLSGYPIDYSFALPFNNNRFEDGHEWDYLVFFIYHSNTSFPPIGNFVFGYGLATQGAFDVKISLNNCHPNTDCTPIYPEPVGGTVAVERNDSDQVVLKFDLLVDEEGVERSFTGKIIIPDNSEMELLYQLY